MVVGTRLGAMSQDGGIELACVVVGYDSSSVGTVGSLLDCTMSQGGRMGLGDGDRGIAEG